MTEHESLGGYFFQVFEDFEPPLQFGSLYLSEILPVPAFEVQEAKKEK